MDLPNLVRSLALGLENPRSLVAQVARIYSFVEALIVPLFLSKFNKINSLLAIIYFKRDGGRVHQSIARVVILCYYADEP
jgi:hypothetical protein